MLEKRVSAFCMKIILITLIPAFVFHSCGSQEEVPKGKTLDISSVELEMSSPPDGLGASHSYKDTLLDAEMVRQLASMLEEKEVPRPACAKTGSLIFKNKKGKRMIEGDLYFSDSCRFFSWYEKDEQHTVELSAGAISLLEANVKEDMKRMAGRCAFLFGTWTYVKMGEQHFEEFTFNGRDTIFCKHWRGSRPQEVYCDYIVATPGTLSMRIIDVHPKDTLVNWMEEMGKNYVRFKWAKPNSIHNIGYILNDKNQLGSVSDWEGPYEALTLMEKVVK